LKPDFFATLAVSNKRRRLECATGQVGPEIPVRFGGNNDRVDEDGVFAANDLVERVAPTVESSWR